MEEPYDLGRLRLSMAGSGNPWTAITSFRKGLLRALHDGLAVSDMARVFGKSSDQIEKELHPMTVANLLVTRGNRYLPTFFIADASETKHVVHHAHTLGRSLAKHLFALWAQIEAIYSELSTSRSYSIRNLGFMLVGAHILDIGLLEALKRDGTLLRPAPARPSPDCFQARYYFWMIEGDLPDLGRYGLDDTELPWPDWHFLSFGQSWIDGVPNSERDALEETCANLVRSNRASNPEALAKRLRVPLLTETDTSLWSELVEACAESLAKVYLEKEGELRRLFSTLRASSYAPQSFSEFFCWYDHVAFASAVDELDAQGLISIPAHLFTAAFWYATGPIRGVL